MKVSTDYSLSARLCDKLVLSLPYPIEGSHGIFILILQRRKLKLREVNLFSEATHNKWRSKDLNPHLLRSKSPCSGALCHIVPSSACLLPAESLLPHHLGPALKPGYLQVQGPQVPRQTAAEGSCSIGVAS